MSDDSPWEPCPWQCRRCCVLLSVGAAVCACKAVLGVCDCFPPTRRLGSPVELVPCDCKHCCIAAPFCRSKKSNIDTFVTHSFEPRSHVKTLQFNFRTRRSCGSTLVRNATVAASTNPRQKSTQQRLPCCSIRRLRRRAPLPSNQKAEEATR